MVFAVMILRMCVTCRLLIPECKCAPNPVSMNPEHYTAWAKKLVFLRRVLLGLFVSFSVLTVVGYHSYFFSTGLTDGIATANAPLNSITSNLETLRDQAYGLRNTYDIIQNNTDTLQASECPYVQFYAPLLATIYSTSNDIASQSNTFANNLLTVSRKLNVWTALNIPLYFGFYPLFMVSVMGFSLSLFLFSKEGIQGVGVFSELLILAAVCFAVLEITLLVSLFVFLPFCTPYISHVATSSVVNRWD